MRICHLRIFFGEVSVQVFGLVFKWVVCSIIECEEFFVYSGHQSFTWSVFCEDFLPVCGLSSVERKSFMLMKTSSSIFPFTNCAFGVVPKKSLPNPRPSPFPPMASSRRFIGLQFTFKWRWWWLLLLLFVCAYPGSRTICWKGCSQLICCAFQPQCGLSGLPRPHAASPSPGWTVPFPNPYFVCSTALFTTGRYFYPLLGFFSDSPASSV